MIVFRKSILLLTPFIFGLFLRGEKDQEDKNFYTPVAGYLEGWHIEWDPEIAESDNAPFFREIRKALCNHFQRIKFLLPKDLPNSS